MSFINRVVTQRPLRIKGAFVKVVEILGSFNVPKVKLVLTEVIETKMQALLYHLVFTRWQHPHM